MIVNTYDFDARPSGAQIAKILDRTELRNSYIGKITVLETGDNRFSLVVNVMEYKIYDD